jgi:hypothetical protein
MGNDFWFCIKYNQFTPNFIIYFMDFTPNFKPSYYFLKKIKIKKNILSQILCLLEINSPKQWPKNSPKIIIIAENMKGCLRFYILIFWILENLGKYIYGLLPLEQHHNFSIKKYQTVGGHQPSFGATPGLCIREGALSGRFRKHDAEAELGGCEPGRIGPPKAHSVV